MRRLTRKRLLLVSGTLVLIVLLILYVGLPIGSALAAVAPQTSADGPAPDGFSEITLTTDDGLELAAWYAPPANGAAIILVHGAGSGRGSVAEYAGMLTGNGFGVLALNLRGFGDSEGPMNRLGWEGSRDIAAAVAFLTAQPTVQAVGGLGLSLGGEVLLGAASQLPALRAVAADGATYRSAGEYESLPENSPWYRSFTQHIFNGFVQLFSGDTPPETTVLQSVREANDTRFLFIAAGAEADELAYNTLFEGAAPGRSDLWVIPGVGHTAGYAANPDAYRSRVADFFGQALPE